MKGIVNLIFFVTALYLGWDYYSFTTDADSELGQRRTTVEQKKLEVEEKEKRIVAAKEFFANLEKKRAELRALSNDLATMKSTLTENNDIPAFMKLVLGEAKRVGLSVRGLSPLQSLPKEYYVEQPFDLVFQGVYVQFIAFLDRLAQAERIVRIDDFTVKPRGSSSRAAKFVELEGTIKVRSFVYVGTEEDVIARRGGSDMKTEPGAAGETTGAPQ